MILGMYIDFTCVCIRTYAYITSHVVCKLTSIFNTFCLQDTLSKVLHLLLSYFNCFIFRETLEKGKFSHALLLRF